MFSYGLQHVLVTVHRFTLTNKDGGVQFSLMCLWICWFILICVYTNPSCVCSCHSSHGGISECFIHVRETWNKAFKNDQMVTSCLSPCDLSCHFPFANLSLCPPARLGREILYLLVWITSFQSSASAEKKGVQLLVLYSCKHPSNPRCGAPMGQHRCPATVPIGPCPSSPGRGPGSGASGATQPRCSLC